MQLFKLKQYIKDLSLKDLINHIMFFMFFSIAIYLYDQSLVCRLFTWFFDFILLSSISFLLFSPKVIIEEVKKTYKKENPLRNGINELINLIFISFLTYNGFWFTLSLFIIVVVLITTIFSDKKLTKRD